MGIENFGGKSSLDKKLELNKLSEEDLAKKMADDARKETEKLVQQKDLDKRLGVNWDEKDATALLGAKYETTGGIAEAIRQDKESMRLAEEANEEYERQRETDVRNDEMDKKYGYGKYKK